MKKLLLFVVVIIISTFELSAQDRVIVLPFYNMDGREELNQYCFMMRDSLIKEFKSGDPEEFNYRIIPSDSVELMIKALALDPNSASYKDDLWGVIEKLNCQRVVIGELQQQGDKFVINVTLYNVEMRLPNNTHQVRNLFATPDNLNLKIPLIAKKLRQGMLGN